LSIHPAIPERYEQALSLLAAGLYDRAGSLLVECVSAEPANLEYAETLLANLKHFSTASLPQEEVARLNAELAEARPVRDAGRAVQLAARLLTTSSPTAQAFIAMADVTAAQNAPELQSRYLEAGIETLPDEVELHRRWAQLLAKRGRFDEAIAAWRRVEEIDPDLVEASRAMARLTIDRSRCLAGLEAAICDMAPDGANESQQEEEAGDSIPLGRWKLPSELTHLTAEIKRTPVQQLELMVREYPSNPEPYLQLASLYLSKGRDYDAERLLAKGREAVGDDLRIRQLWEDVVMVRLNARVADAQQHAEVEQTPTARAALSEARTKRDRQELEIYQQRAAREPDNAKVQYQLGLRLKRAGKLGEAARRFEAALADPLERSAAAFALGECLQQAGQLAEALRAYRQSADSASPAQSRWRKLALMNAAEVARRGRLFRRARRYVSDLLRVDPHDHQAAQMLAELERQRF
jgi:tetratricopeptide (TPR) repeat protein